MKRVLMLLALLVVGLLVHAAPSPRPTGKNCTLSVPPAAAGEEFDHGVTLRIFPRAKSITASYSGCQTLFAPNGGGWVVVSITEVVHGDPVRLWSPEESDPNVIECRYKNGRVLSGVAERCAAPEFLLVKSLAPGCVKKIQAAVAAGGIGAPTPQGCEYE